MKRILCCTSVNRYKKEKVIYEATTNKFAVKLESQSRSEPIENDDGWSHPSNSQLEMIFLGANMQNNILISIKDKQSTLLFFPILTNIVDLD